MLHSAKSIAGARTFLAVPVDESHGKWPVLGVLAVPEGEVGERRVDGLFTEVPIVRRIKYNFLLAVLICAFAARYSTQVVQAQSPSWQFVTIPGLPANCKFGGHSVWARNRNDVYALAYRTTPATTDVPESFLYRWDGGNWTQVLHLSGHSPGSVFGVGDSEVFVTAYRCELGYAAGCGANKGGQVYRSVDHGTSWVAQVLPPEVGVNDVGGISGTANNVHVIGGGGRIIRFDGTNWTTVFTDSAQLVYAESFVGPTEGYYVTCWGWGKWDGQRWQFHGVQFDFCDVFNTWAFRDGGGLHWYTVGGNNFSNGIRVWRFNEATQSFGSKFGYVFSDGNAQNIGNAAGVWGSAANDVYVVGELAAQSGGMRTGRIYHFDGGSWNQITNLGVIPSAYAVTGTSRDDVWVALSDGELLHFSEPSRLALDFNIGTNSLGSSRFAQTLGWEFTVNEPINVTHLGVFDDQENGLAVSHQVALWNQSGVMLAGGTVDAGSGVPLDSQFRFVAVTPTTLDPGTYVIGAQYSSNSTDRLPEQVATITTDPAITFFRPRYGLGESLTFPNISQTGTNYFGPMFKLVRKNSASADLSLAKSASSNAVSVGSDLTYTIIVTNRGPSAASGVTVTDNLPAGVSFLSASASQGSCTNTGSIVTCNVGTLATGASVTVTILVTAESLGTIVNRSSVTASTADPDLTNNNDTAQTTVVSGTGEATSWQRVTIPGLPANCKFGGHSIWARNRNDVYALAYRTTPATTDVPESFLYRWNGANWTQVLHLSGHSPGSVFGVGDSEVFVTAYRCELGYAAGCGANKGGQVYRSVDRGTNWTAQSLPPEVGANDVGGISGTLNNVHVIVGGGRIIRFDGTNWTTVFTDSTQLVYAESFVSPAEGYYVTCWGWGKWDGQSWQFHGVQFDFCDVYNTWAFRDSGGLHWYAVGGNNFSNGIRVWRFNEATQSFGSKFGYVFADGDGFNVGEATGVWGSAANDVYIIGQLAPQSGGVRTGRIYHFDGSSWNQITNLGVIPSAYAVTGTSHDDVWVALADGELLHFGETGQTNQPPEITDNPKDQTVVAGTTAAFNIAASGALPLSYRWFYNGTNAINGETNRLLTLIAVEAANAGQYHVVVSNVYGLTISAPATLSVISAPIITNGPQSTNVSPSSAVTFTVRAIGSGLNYQWFKNGISIPGATNDSYALTNVKIEDGGSYTVSVANQAGVTLRIATLLVTDVTIPLNPTNDFFAARISIGITNAYSGFDLRNNSGATNEPGEPYHSGKSGGRSVWFSWRAPADGIATVRTFATTFDTLLAIYTGTSVSNLLEVASDDDDATDAFLGSKVSFNAKAGTDYQIAVDGLSGAEGAFALGWELDVTEETLPVIIRQPVDQTVQRGSTAVLSVVATNSPQSPLYYQWYFKGKLLRGETSATLTITNVQTQNLGFYAVHLPSPGFTSYVESHPAVLAIGPQPNLHLKFKTGDLLSPEGLSTPQGQLQRAGLEKQGPMDSSAFVSVGQGSTIDGFTADNLPPSSVSRNPNDWNNCNQGSLNPRWFRIMATNEGTLQIDTVGSSTETALAIYTWSPLGIATKAYYRGCDRTGAPGGMHSLMRMNVTNISAADYLIEIDTTTNGFLVLNIGMGNAPSSLPSPTNKLVRQGETLVLPGRNTSATPQPTYTWFRRGENLPIGTGPDLVRTNIQASDAGEYSVVVSNRFGVVTNIALVKVEVPFHMGVGRWVPDGNGKFLVSVIGEVSKDFVIQVSTNLIDWMEIGFGPLRLHVQDGDEFTDPAAGLFTYRFYRAIPLLQGTEPHLDSAGNFGFLVPEVQNQGFVIEASTNLVDWRIQTNVSGAPDQVFIDPDSANHRTRFYRLRPAP